MINRRIPAVLHLAQIVDQIRVHVVGVAVRVGLGVVTETAGVGLVLQGEGVPGDRAQIGVPDLLGRQHAVYGRQVGDVIGNDGVVGVLAAVEVEDQMGAAPVVVRVVGDEHAEGLIQVFGE